MMEADDEDRAEMFKKEEKIDLGFDVGSDWDKDGEESMIKIKKG